MSRTVVSWEGVAAILAFVLLDVATGLPTYIGCDATVTEPGKPSSGKQLTADGGMQVMKGPIVTHPSDSLTVTDVVTNLVVQHYDVGGRSYRVTLVRDGSAPEVGVYCWSSHGSITQSSDAACPRYHHWPPRVSDVEFTWESPAGASPNVTLQCFYATGFGGGLSSASTLLGTQPEFFEAVAAAPNATVAGLAGTGCRNAGWVGTKEAQRWMYWGLVVLWAGMVAR